MTDQHKTPGAMTLLSCPFCGGEPSLTHDHYVHDDLRPMPTVECKSCSAWVRVEDWNRRAQRAAQPNDDLLARFPEINFSNYGQQEVEALQAWAFEALDQIQAASLTDKQQRQAIELLNLADHALSHASLDSLGDVIEHTQDRRDHMRVQIIVFLKALGDRQLTAPIEQGVESATCAESQVEPAAQRQGGHPEGRRERFQKWVIATKHPVFGFLDGRSLARSDDREGYADEYVQGLWVAFKEFAEQPEPVTDMAFSEWMGEHGREALSCELGIEDLMEGAFEAGAKSNRRALRNDHPAPEAFDPCGWTDRQVLDFLGCALRNVDIVGEVRISEIRQGFQYMRDRSVKS